jgi:predicted outer membrane repeat protein
MLVLAVVAVAFPSLTAAAPPVTETEAIGTAQQLAAHVGGYSTRHPNDPGAFGPWAGKHVEAGAPLLIHSYPVIEPSYYYVPLTSQPAGTTSYVTVDALTGDWQAFGKQTALASLPKVTGAHAAQRAAAELGTAVSAADLCVVGMPNKRLYWYWRSLTGARELFINVSDPSDVHTFADEEISPPQPDAEPPRADAPRAATPGDLHARTGTRYPTSHDIDDVPHHYQLTDYNCGPATVQMVMDYWGPEIGQQHVAEVANTSPSGTHISNMMRAAQFSAISSAIQNPWMRGYDERRLGYGALECYWSQPGEGDPDFPDRHNDLKSLISANYPIIIVTRYDSSSYGSHARVAKGYDDSTAVYIVHDPWYNGVYQGPDVHFNQDFLVDELWPRSFRWGTLVAPWEISVDAPAEVLRGTPFTVTAHVVYTGPHPFDAQDETQFPTVALLPSDLCSLAPGECSTRTLSGWFSDSGCVYESVTWELTADTLVQTGAVEFLARGLLHDSSTSYPSYSDSIGGRVEVPLSIIDADTLMVDAAGGGHFTAIQDALDFVADGQTVEVLPGIYRGPGNRDLTFHGKDVRVRGVRGPDATVIDCEGAGRGFVLTEGEGRDALIEGLTIVNGRAPGSGLAEEAGGGIYLNGASPTIRNIVLKYNSSPGAAGGLCCLNQANPLLERCTFLENQAAFRGGAVASGDGSIPEFVNCTLVANDAPECGGIFCHASSPLLIDTIIYGSLDGGAVACEQGAAPALTFCCVYGNAGGDSLPGSCSAEGMLFADPLFCDAARGALQLQECSPCIASGASGGHIGASPARCACIGTEPLSIALKLHAARPSPFTDSTTLELDVPPDAGQITLAVYNVRGQLVRTLVDAAVSPGRREFVWDGMDEAGHVVSAGTYFARCGSDAGTDEQKLVLVK